MKVTGTTMGRDREQSPALSHPHRPGADRHILRAGSYGLVLLLIVVDYVVVSAVTGYTWGRAGIILLLGVTLLITLRTAQARRIWQLLAALYLAASILLTLVSIIAPDAKDYSQQISIIAGLLLLVTPFTILRHLITQRTVTTEMVLGAVCVYLLVGFSFAFIYIAMGFVSGVPFFGGKSPATSNDYLFFSYTTLTTVGYGNLVPVDSLGQTFAMLEALFGQIYLVLVVARLVSLWGQERPRLTARPPDEGET